MDLLSNIRALIKQAEEVQAQPHLANSDNAAMAVEQQTINAQALQSGGTVEQQQLESLQKGLGTPSAQASGEDQVIELQKAAAVSELVSGGLDFYSAVDAVAEADMELQKEAAFHQLVSEGYDFEDAVELVKAASEVEFYVDEEVEKRAAFEELLSEGLSFDEASEIIKEASLGENNFIRKGRDVARNVGRAVGKAVEGNGKKIGLGAAAAAGVAGVAGGAYALSRRKKSGEE